MRIRYQITHGNPRWVVDYRDGKSRRHQKFFPSRDKAVEFANTVTANVPTRQTAPSHTIRQLFQDYINLTAARRLPTSSQALVYKFRSLNRALQSLGTVYTSQLTTATFENLVHHLRETGRADHTILSLVGAYRAAVRWACEQGVLDRVDVGRMQLATPQQTRDRYLTKPEIAQLLELLAGDCLELPAVLGIYQGLRRSEVCNLQVRDVELDLNQLTVTKSKTKDWRVIQLHPCTIPHLTPALQKPADDWLCKNTLSQRWKPDALTHHFGRALKEIGPAWSDVSFHTLRHTCASQMALSGKYTLYQISRFLGHKSTKTTEKYAHLLPGQVRPDW